MKINEILKNLRHENGLKQKDIAIKLNISTSTYSAWEIGRNEPKSDDLIKLANIFQCSVDYLIGRESEDGKINLSELTENEQKLLYKYNKLNKYAKIQLFAYIEGLLASPLAKENI